MDLKRIYQSSTIGRIADWTALGQLAFAFVSFCGGGALLSWGASTIEPIMRYGWGAAIFAGIAITCCIIITISVAAFAVKAFFPKNFSNNLEELFPNKAIRPDIEMQKLYSEIQGEKENIKSKYEILDKNFISLSQNAEIASERLDRLDVLLKPKPVTMTLGEIGKTAPPATDRFDSIEKNISKIEDRLTSLDIHLNDRSSKIEQRVEQLNSDTFETFHEVQKVITSERVLESYVKNSNEIANLADKLDDPRSKADIYEDWNQWETDFSQFKAQISMLDRFLRTHTDLKPNFFDTPTDLYVSKNWTYNFDSMSDDQKFNYKTYKIIWMNFKDSKTDIYSKLYNATFLKL